MQKCKNMFHFQLNDHLLAPGMSVCQVFLQGEGSQSFHHMFELEHVDQRSEALGSGFRIPEVVFHMFLD